jgi:AcrR family transcriptional regulator
LSSPLSSPGPRLPLSRDRILRAALQLADERGIDALSMRRLGQALGVEAMSLYNHVQNKDEVLGGIVDLVVEEFELPQPGGDWEEGLRRTAISAHAALLRHRWAAALMVHVVSDARIRYIEAVLRCVREAGFSPELAFHAYHAIDSHILGFTLWEIGHTIGTEGADLQTLARDFLARLPEHDFPYFYEHVHQHLDPSLRDDRDEFEFGLELVLDGLRQTLA